MTEETQKEIKELKKIIKDLSKRVKLLEAVTREYILMYNCKQIIKGVTNAN